MSHYHQLIGYAVLNFLDNGPPVKELAVYFSRFSQTVRWPAPRLSDVKYEPFLLWFCKSAAEVSGTGNLISELATSSALLPKIKALAAEFNAAREEHKCAR